MTPPMTAENPLTDCPICSGQGWFVTVEPDCCGRVSELGYCRGDCAVPREVQAVCGACGGSGQIEDMTMTAENPETK